MEVEKSLLTQIAEWSSLVGLAGVAIALVQLFRTQRVVKATEKAIRRTEKHLATNQVLVLIPQLVRLEAEIDLAASAGAVARDGLVRHLAEWRRLSTEIAGLIRTNAKATEDTVLLLQRSAVTVAQAKAKVLDPKVTDFLGATDRARRQVAGACEEMGRLVGDLKAYSGEGLS